MAKNGLTGSDSKRRDFILNGSMWRVVPYICVPLALYQGFTGLFKVIDNLMASHIGAASVSAVAYLNQINQIIMAIGNGLAVGGGILISRNYGSGDYDNVKKFVSSLFAMCCILSALVLMLIPITPLVLKFFGTPQALIDEGRGYFAIGIVNLVITFFNSVYMAVERSRGNSKKILILNIVSIIVKFVLTAIFVYVLESGLEMVAFAGCLASLSILLPGLITLIFEKSVFSFSPRSVTFNREISGNLLNLSYPVVIDKMSFAAGKIAVNRMSADFGDLTVGALGISDNINGMVTNLQNGFQDGCASIVSQNIGAGNRKRAMEAVKVSFVWTLCISIIGFTLSWVFLPQIAALFSGGNDDFAAIIMWIYRYEAIGIIPMSLNTASMSVLYGFGKTKLTFVVNFCRVLVFRVPVLWFMKNFTGLGLTSVGLVICFSNICVSFLSFAIALVVYRKEIRGK